MDMKSLLITAAMSLAMYSGQALSHGSHGVVDADGAKMAAARMVQKMTVRDFGFKAGQLAPEWRNISESQVAVRETGEGFYIVEVTKAESEDKVYVKVLRNGDVSNVSTTYPQQ
tara:strand:+ start:856 stop:1197 length:342 start_codon:yes stop_codon:yes gene_type:complete